MKVEMSCMMYDPDYNTTIESQWWSLLQRAAYKGLELRLIVKLKPGSKNTCYLDTEIYKDNEKIAQSSETLLHETQHYYSVEKFIKNYKEKDEN